MDLNSWKFREQYLRILGAMNYPMSLILYFRRSIHISISWWDRVVDHNFESFLDRYHSIILYIYDKCLWFNLVLGANTALCFPVPSLSLASVRLYGYCFCLAQKYLIGKDVLVWWGLWRLKYWKCNAFKVRYTIQAHCSK